MARKYSPHGWTLHLLLTGQQCTQRLLTPFPLTNAKHCPTSKTLLFSSFQMLSLVVGRACSPAAKTLVRIPGTCHVLSTTAPATPQQLPHLPRPVNHCTCCAPTTTAPATPRQAPHLPRPNNYRTCRVPSTTAPDAPFQPLQALGEGVSR